VSPVRTIDEAVSDPHFSSRGVIKQVHGKHHIGLPFSLSGLSIDFERQSPSHGEHTQEILASLGYDRQATQDLLQAGVVLAGKD
jgi:crotonobetainyl-CoA:carnitine CoA-transferase CaiB-like acyl-CoA transferase